MSADRVRRYTAASLEAPDRLFQITQVSRSHTRLWLQSNAVPHLGHPYRLEVLFQWVQFLCVPFALRGLSLRRATQDESARLSDLHGLEIDPRWSVYLLSRDHDWFVVSGNPLWAEADLAYNEKLVFCSAAGDDNEKLISVGTLE